MGRPCYICVIVVDSLKDATGQKERTPTKGEQNCHLCWIRSDDDGEYSNCTTGTKNRARDNEADKYNNAQNLVNTDLRSSKGMYTPWFLHYGTFYERLVDKMYGVHIQHTNTVMVATGCCAVILAVIPFKYILMAGVVYSAVMTSKVGRSMQNDQSNRRMREWWDSIPIIPVEFTDNEASATIWLRGN